MADGWHIRTLQRIDARAIQALGEVLIDCVEGGASVSFMLPLSRGRANAFWHSVAASLERGQRIVLVAEDGDGVILGTVQVLLDQPENQPHRGDIAKMLVHRAARRRGLGAALLAAAERSALAAGKTLLVLDTVTGADGDRLYARAGWQRCGEIPQYALWPDGRPCATTIYFKFLGGPAERSIDVPAALPGQGTTPSEEQILRHLRHAIAVSRRAVDLGHHPFGAILVAPDQQRVLLEQCNVDTVNHAESTLARVAANRFTPEYLWGCTLYTTVEPCCMCAGTAYWANIGRVVFGMSEQQLRGETGNHRDNPTLNLPARAVFERGQKPVEVIGPVARIVPEVLAMHRAYWLARASP